MKKSICVLIVIIFLSTLFFGVNVFADETGKDGTKIQKPEITSGNLVVVRSADTEQILLKTSNGEKVSPTVIAKLMSAIIAYDMMSSLDEVATVPAEAVLVKNIGQNGDISCPRLGLGIGEKLTLRQLFYGTLVSAANDACYTLVNYISDGDIKSFIEKMNEKAKSIGCENTLFTNCVGMEDNVSYTTAEDASLIAAEFCKYTTLLNISSQPTYVLGNTIHTKNYLLSKILTDKYYMEGVTGMIAGQARPDSGYCLVTSAEKDGLTYVYVVMEGPGEIRNKDGTRDFPAGNAYTDIKKVFHWALDSFSYITLADDHEIIGEIPVTVASENADHVNYVTEKAIELLMPMDTKVEDVKRSVTIYNDSLEAPISRGTVVGKLELIYEDEIIASVDLITNADVERSRILAVFGALKNIIHSSTVKVIVKIIIWIIIAYIVLVIATKIAAIIKKANEIAQKRELQRRREELKNKEKIKKDE